MVETAAPSRSAEQVERGPVYEEDLVLWTQRQAALIRAGRLPGGIRRDRVRDGTFPQALPHTPQQILDDDFHPGPIDER